MRRARQWIAQRIWDVGQWLYPYPASTDDDTEQAVWTMEANYIGTERQATDWFTRLCELDCEGKHALHECGFAVGGMHRSELDDPTA